MKKITSKLAKSAISLFVFAFMLSISSITANAADAVIDKGALQSGIEYTGDTTKADEAGIHSYKFDVADTTAFRMTCTPEGSPVSPCFELQLTGGGNNKLVSGDIGILGKGSYELLVKASAGAYTFKLELQPIDWGKVEIIPPSGKVSQNQYSSYNVKYTQGVNFDTEENASNKLVKKNDIEVRDDVSDDKPHDLDMIEREGGVSFYVTSYGRKTIDVTVKADLYISIPDPAGSGKIARDVKHFTANFDVSPARPNAPQALSGTDTTMKVYVNNGYSNQVAIEMFDGSAWNKVQDGTQIHLYYDASGLKPNTTYKFRAYAYDPNNPEIKSDYTSECSATTAPGAPTIKSVKVKKVKYRKIPKTWVKPWWDSQLNYHKGYWIKAHWVTDVTLNVKLKSKVQGAQVIEVCGNCGGQNISFKTSGNSASIKGIITYEGKKKGKKIVVTSRAYGDKSGNFKGSYSKKVTAKIPKK